MHCDRTFISRASRLAFVVLLACNSQAMAQNQDEANTAHPNRWNIVYEAGTAPFGVGIRIHVTITKGEVIFEGRKGASFSISAPNITAVSSNLTSEHTATRAQAAAWGGLAQFSPYTLLFLPFGIPVMAATYPIKSKYAYFSLLWSEKNTNQEVQFRLDRKDYEPFLTELQKSTGKEWKNLESEWKQLKDALSSGTGRQTELRLERRVRVGIVDIRPGLYQLVVLTRGPNEGEAYLFANHGVKVEQLISSAQVKIANASEDNQTEAVILRQDEDGVNRISSIRIDGQVVRFP